MRRTGTGLRLRDGQTAILVALALPLLLVILGFVVDGGHLFVEKRHMQNAADAAALAAASKLPTDNTACTGTCFTDLAAVAVDYSQANAGPDRLCAPPGIVDDCIVVTTPYIDPSRVQVTIHEHVSYIFAGVLGLSGHTVSAKAAASASPVTGTSTTAGSTTPPQTIAGTTNPGSVSTGTITTGGAGALLFAHCGWGHTGDIGSPADPCTGTANECTAMHISGSNNTFYGAIGSNGGVQDSADNFGKPPTGDAGLYYGPQIDTSKCLRNQSSIDATFAVVQVLTQRVDWAVPPPTLNCSDGSVGDATHNNYACPAGTYATKVNGVACTRLSTGKFTVDSATDPSGAAWNGLYCAGGALTINKAGITLNNAGFIAPSITWSSGNNVATGYTGLFSQYGGLFLDAYASGGLNWSGSNDSWTGAIFAPNGNAQVSGGGVQGVCAGTEASACGFIEGSTVQLSGSDGVWRGLGPTTGGTTTTTTSTVQGTTDPGTTVAGTTNPGSTQTVTTDTTVGLDE